MKTQCTHCGGTNLTWDWRAYNKSDVQEGRLRTNDISVQFYLGCDDCSETLQVMSPAKVTALLNEQLTEKIAETQQVAAEQPA